MGIEARGIDSLSKHLGRTLDTLSQKQILTPHWERALLSANWPAEYSIRVYNKEREYDGYFHPSGDCLKGELQLFYEHHPEFRKNLEFERNSPQLEMTFQVGHAYHALVESMLIHLGFTTPEDCEYKFRDEEHRVSGTLDVRKCYLPDGTWIPLDVKSAGFLPVNKPPHPAYVAQLNVYMDLAYDEPQERGILFYIEKPSPHRVYEHVVERDEDLLEEIYERWYRVREALEKDSPAGLRQCCMPHTDDHRACPARNVCLIGPPKPAGVR